MADRVGRVLGSRRVRVTTGAALALLLTSAYGYGPEQDPFVEQAKRLVSEAREGRWTEAERALAELTPVLREISRVLGVDAEPELAAAVRGRDPGALAHAYVRLAYLAIRVKFVSSQAEGLERYYAAKYRNEAARSYYAELLAPAVRRHDAQRGTSHHAAIWSGFDAARDALGRPGFLGRGRESPDVEAFARAGAAIGTELREVFPFLSEVQP